ncbi:MAG: hypothetical protein ACRCZ2_02445, partial [Fusobacteriaceae bacterium]
SDGVNSLENIEVKLISKKGEIIKRIYTSEKGNFFLDHISDSFYILIESENFISYQTEIIKLDKNIKNFYINLIKK